MSAAVPVDPGDLSWREQKKLLTRRALHEAARSLVLASGVGAVTVEEICAEAGVSPRTFFNYYPSKSAAALGLPDLRIADAQREEFIAGRTGNVVHDLCELLGSVLASSGDRLADKASNHDLVARRPELQPELYGWLAGFRRQVMELAALRLPPAEALSAATLALAALTEAVNSGDTDRDDLGHRLWTGVVAMCTVAGFAPAALQAFPEH